jgi:outer membrane protein assembly factor BamD (BamD/ComL family)
MRTMKAMLRALLMLVFLVSPRGPFVEAAERGVLLTEAMQLKVADAFMEEGEYYRAVTEYKRFLILFPDSDRADYALFRTGLACYRGEEYESAAKCFSALREGYRESGYAPQARYFEGLSYWKSKQYGAAASAFESLVNSYPESESAPLALVAAAMLALEQENVDASRRRLQTLATTYPDYPSSLKARDAVNLLDQYQNLPRKSEILAGVMSAVVPGSGYFYAEHYGDGVTAFLINALAIAGIVTATYHENYAVAGIVGGIGLPFYFGNIYGSANAAKKWNLALRKELRNKIQVTLSYDF